jgi:hypothetical protein
MLPWEKGMGLDELFIHVHAKPGSAERAHRAIGPELVGRAGQGLNAGDGHVVQHIVNIFANDLARRLGAR